MLRLSKKTIAFVSVLGLLSLASCTDDKKNPENALNSSSTDNPASPNESDLNAETVYFAFDSSSLDNNTQSKLTTISSKLAKATTSKLEVAGHTDERGTSEYNLALGQRRANAVKGYLVNLGVEDARVSTISYGKERPVSEGHAESDWSQNRRAEVTLAH